jgi:hypothetical protein
MKEIIRELIEMLDGGKDEYCTVIIGVFLGNKETVTITEKEFDLATNDLLSKNGFIKLSDFSFKEIEKE